MGSYLLARFLLLLAIGTAIRIMNMDSQTQSILSQIGHGARPSEDAVADALLLYAVRNDALTPDEAGELEGWDLPTISEFLALRLNRLGYLTQQEVEQLILSPTDSYH
jgi:hypothetical protein